MKSVFEKIDTLTDEYINILEDVVNIESPSLEKDRVDEVGRYFIELSNKNGWEIEIKKFEDFGDIRMFEAVCSKLRKKPFRLKICVFIKSCTNGLECGYRQAGITIFIQQSGTIDANF